MTIKCVWQGKNTLGESPLWDHEKKILFWLDIEAQLLFALKQHEKTPKTWVLPSMPGCIGLAKDHLVVALRKGFALFDLKDESLLPLDQPISDRHDLRFNDGKCDRFGRFYAGTMDLSEKAPLGSLYRLNGDGSSTLLDNGFTVSNGLGFSPDNQYFYFTDSPARKIYRYRFDPKTGNVSNREIFVTVPENQGYPDGLCVDSEGFIWSAHWDGWRLTRYNPKGEVNQVIEMHVPRPTSCCLGGEDLKTLFVTSARRDLSEAILEKAPSSGSVFGITVDTPGIPESHYQFYETK